MVFSGFVGMKVIFLHQGGDTVFCMPSCVFSSNFFFLTDHRGVSAACIVLLGMIVSSIVYSLYA
jgi:hypothetical protein